MGGDSEPKAGYLLNLPWQIVLGVEVGFGAGSRVEHLIVGLAWWTKGILEKRRAETEQKKPFCFSNKLAEPLVKAFKIVKAD